MPDRVARRARQVKRLDDNRATLDAAFAKGHSHSMQIYKILRAAEWAELEQSAETLGAPIDVSDGFIHFSTAEQAAETAARHFAGQDGLILAAFDADVLGPALKWEISRGGDKFPHLFAPLRRADVVWHAPLPLVDGVHVFPKGL